MPKAIATSITSTLTRSRVNTTMQQIDEANTELAEFRERMLATNSANDLAIRDVNMLLEDYKNLLFILFKL